MFARRVLLLVALFQMLAVGAPEPLEENDESSEVDGLSPTGDDKICHVLDTNYCYYFGDSSCYIRLCKCSKCLDTATHDANNSTSSEDCPPWCSDQNIVNIFASNSEAKEVEMISFKCKDLKNNCLKHRGFNGHCFFHARTCPHDAEVDAKAGGKEQSPAGGGSAKHVKQCKKKQRTCARKWPKHYACRFFKRRCRTFDLPPLADEEVADLRAAANALNRTSLEDHPAN